MSDASDNGGWVKRVLMWDWHDLIRKGWPGWERGEDPTEPWRVNMAFVKGKGKSSHEVASEFDDVATAAFYWRDFTDDNIPFVRKGEGYRSAFWFARREDQELFVKTYCPNGATT